MLRKSLIVFVIAVFLFSALTLTEAYASKNHGPSTAGIEVYDTNGQYLGVLDSLIGSAIVYVPSLSSFVDIDVRTGASHKTKLYFQSDDCTGTPYVWAWATYTIYRVGEKYYTGAKTVPVKMELHSRFFDARCWSDRTTWYVVPAEEVPADLLPFTFPVALPLEFK